MPPIAQKQCEGSTPNRFAGGLGTPGWSSRLLASRRYTVATGGEDIEMRKLKSRKCPSDRDWCYTTGEYNEYSVAATGTARLKAGDRPVQ